MTIRRCIRHLQVQLADAAYERGTVAYDGIHTIGFLVDIGVHVAGKGVYEVIALIAQVIGIGTRGFQRSDILVERHDLIGDGVHLRHIELDIIVVRSNLLLYLLRCCGKAIREGRSGIDNGLTRR